MNEYNVAINEHRNGSMYFFVNANTATEAIRLASQRYRHETGCITETISCELYKEENNGS